MLTIEVPDEVGGPIVAEAERIGTTATELAVTYLRGLVAVPPAAGTSLTFLGSRVGSVIGTGEAFSHHTGRRSADGLATDR